jgi:hypothetical protein
MAINQDFAAGYPNIAKKIKTSNQFEMKKEKHVTRLELITLKVLVT